MYGIFTYIYHKNQLNVGKYTMHGLLGYDKLNTLNRFTVAANASNPVKLFEGRRVSNSNVPSTEGQMGNEKRVPSPSCLG